MDYAYGSEDYYVSDSAVYEGSAMYEAGSEVMTSEPPRPAAATVVTAEELLAQTVNERVARVAKTMNVSDATATFLLAAFKYDPERTITAFFENAPRAAATAGVKVVQPPADPEIIRVAQGDCSVCFDDGVDVLHLGCGHAACLSCWRNNIEFRLTSSGNRAWFGLCPVPKCGRPAGDAVTAVAAPDLQPRLRERLARSYVECANNSLACAGPACDRFIVCPGPRTQMPQGPGSCVLCRHCDTSTCVHCAQPNHLPTNCSDLKKWIGREHEDSANANWIMANTKQCPKCHNAIEKNQGCNHMTCKHCGHHFCWICMMDWNSHEGGAQGGYSCNKYVKNERVAVAQAELEKYIHYYSRFRIHERSRELDSAITRKAREIIDAMVQAMRAKLHELNYWERAAAILSACRRTLMYSYVYAYYLPTETPHDKGAKDLFEYQQAQLEHSTENLSELVTVHAQRPDNVTQTVAEEVIKRTAIAEQMLRQIEAGLGQ